MLGSVKSKVREWRYRYQLFLLLCIFGLVIARVLLYGVFYLYDLSVTSDRDAINAQATSDLQRVAAQLQTEAGRVLIDPQNALQFSTKIRKLQPVVLTKQFYISRQIGLGGRPMEPPGSCFVWLETKPSQGSKAEDGRTTRLCSYVSSQRTSGLWLYFVVSLPTEQIFPHAVGDIGSSGFDSLILEIRRGETIVPLNIRFQVPTPAPRSAQFDLAAYTGTRVGESLPLKADQFQGWAYASRDSVTNSAVTMITARVAFRLLDPLANPQKDDFQWPPQNLSEIHTRVKWVRATEETTLPTLLDAAEGEAAMSFPSLFEGFVRTPGVFSIYREHLDKSKTEIWKSASNSSTIGQSPNETPRLLGRLTSFTPPIVAREDISEPNSIVADAVASEAKPTPPDRGQ